MKSHIKESSGHVFEFLPEIFKNSIFSKIQAELHFLKKNAILKSSGLIEEIRIRFQQDLNEKNRDLKSEYFQRMGEEISQIRETTRAELQEIVKAMNSVKCKQENYELTAEFVEIILLDLKKSKFLSPLLSQLEEVKKSISSKILQISDTKYVGRVMNGKAKGRGIGTNQRGVFEGYWKNNVLNGIGIAKCEMFWYFGELKGEYPQGRGFARFPNGDSYDGEWKEGEREGRGVERLANGDSYDGEWKEGEQEGRGIYKTKNDDCFVVEIKNGEIISKNYA